MGYIKSITGFTNTTEIHNNMSKRKSSVELPDIVNMDDLALLSDEELSGRAGRLEADRRRAASTSSDLVPWETEIAYVRREQQLRETRARIHTDFMKGAPVVEQEEIAEEVA